MIHPAAVLTAVEHHREAAARPAHITVRTGETLSGIAARYRIEWPGLYEANRATIGANPSLITAGDRLRIPSATAAVRLAARYTPPAPAPVQAPPAGTVSYQQPQAPVQPAPAQAAPAAYSAPAQAAPAAYSAPSGSFQQCVINAESGGSSQVMNSTGHYGLYQFSYSTWVANGGSAGSFGSASVGEQNQVFNHTVASSGTSAWAPYDGC